LQFGLNGLDHRAHFLGRGRFAGGGGDFGDGCGDQGAEAGFVEGFGQELLDDDNFGSFSGGQFRPIALGELLDGVAALLDHGGQRLLGLCGREGLALLDGLVLERVLDEAQSGGADRIVGLHGGNDLLGDDEFECACVGHGLLPLCSWSASRNEDGSNQNCTALERFDNSVHF